MTADPAVILDNLIRDWSATEATCDIATWLGVDRATFDAWERDEITAEQLLATRTVTP